MGNPEKASTPDELAALVIGRLKMSDEVTPEHGLAEEIADAIRAALAARDAEWREAVTETFGPFAIEMVMDGTAAHSGGLRALLSEGKPGQ